MKSMMQWMLWKLGSGGYFHDPGLNDEVMKKVSEIAERISEGDSSSDCRESYQRRD